jgi:hypothetical protein
MTDDLRCPPDAPSRPSPDEKVYTTTRMANPAGEHCLKQSANFYPCLTERDRPRRRRASKSPFTPGWRHADIRTRSWPRRIR